MKSPAAAISANNPNLGSGNSNLTNLDEEYNILFGFDNDDDGIAESTSGGRKKKKLTTIKDMREMRQKEVVLLNLRKEERSLETELQFGLNIYISLVVSIAFLAPGIVLTFYALGVGDIFKTDDRSVKIVFLCLAILCYIPILVWLYIVFCPGKEEYFRRKSIRLDRKLRAAIDAKRKAIYFDEEDIVKETEEVINRLEVEIKELQALQVSLIRSKRAGAYEYKDSKIRITSRNDFFGSKATNKVVPVISSQSPAMIGTPPAPAPLIVPLYHPSLINRPVPLSTSKPGSPVGAASRSTSIIKNADSRVSFNLSDQNNNIRPSRSSSKRLSVSGKLK
eukprot:gene23960-31100_t